MDIPEHAWVVRAGNENELADLVDEKGAVAIGWREMQDLSHLRTREEFKKEYHRCYPDSKGSRLNVNAGQIYRFAREISNGDYVLTYDKSKRELIVGNVIGPYEYNPDIFPWKYNHVRRVEWIMRISRDIFTPSAKNSLGSALTVFLVDDHLEEIHRLISGEEEQKEEASEETPPFYDEVKAKADELIADLVSQLDAYDFQDLVAALLRAMGFRAVSSEPGRDRGVDIVAHPDAFGFERPRIKVQVKHRRGSVGGPEMREFLATLRTGDSGLYISTGGFSRDAFHESEKSREPVKLFDRDGFIRLLLENYEEIDPEYKAKIPLRKVWLPAE